MYDLAVRGLDAQGRERFDALLEGRDYDRERRRWFARAAGLEVASA